MAPWVLKGVLRGKYREELPICFFYFYFLWNSQQFLENKL